MTKINNPHTKKMCSSPVAICLKQNPVISKIETLSKICDIDLTKGNCTVNAKNNIKNESIITANCTPENSTHDAHEDFIENSLKCKIEIGEIVKLENCEKNEEHVNGGTDRSEENVKNEIKADQNNEDVKKTEDRQLSIIKEQLFIRIERLNPRILKKFQKYDSIKASSALVCDLMDKKPRRIPKFTKSPKRVILTKENFSITFLKNAFRRGATVVDKEGILKFKCPSCSFKTYSDNALSKHHAGLHGRPLPRSIMKCPECDYTYTGQSNFKRHMETHKKEPDLSCEFCPYKTRFSCTLRIHLRKWHLSKTEAKAWRCSECNFTSVAKSTYEAHMAVHLNGRSSALAHRFVSKSSTADAIKCSYCRFEAPHENALHTHMKTTHQITNLPIGKKMYKCKSCFFVTQYHHSFREHTLSFHTSKDETEIFRCYNCDYEAKSRKRLREHILAKHNASKLLTCKICEKQFVFRHMLKNHVKVIHAKQKKTLPKVSCHECGYETYSKGKLREHIFKKHINPQPKMYSCLKCDFVTESQVKHMKHKRKHKMYCDRCDYKTSDKSSLKYHIIGHMDKNRQSTVVHMYRCQECEYITRNRHFFERHLDRWNHTFEGPYIVLDPRRYDFLKLKENRECNDIAEKSNKEIELSEHEESCSEECDTSEKSG